MAGDNSGASLLFLLPFLDATISLLRSVHHAVAFIMSGCSFYAAVKFINLKFVTQVEVATKTCSDYFEELLGSPSERQRLMWSLAGISLGHTEGRCDWSPPRQAPGLLLRCRIICDGTGVFFTE